MKEKDLTGTNIRAQIQGTCRRQIWLIPNSLKRMYRVNYTFLKGGNTLTIIKFFHEPSHYSPSTHQLPAPITPFNT